MKEPITGRDLFVISTLCTGFGALLAWGLFYRWDSMPVAKPVDYAAWFQAIGGMLSVLVAAAVPTAIFLKESQKNRIRENARAKCVLAVSLDPLTGQLLRLSIALASLNHQRTGGELHAAKDATKALDVISESLKVAHEFPDLCESLLKFVLRLDDAHKCTISTINNDLRGWISGRDDLNVDGKIRLAFEAGGVLYEQICELMPD